MATFGEEAVNTPQSAFKPDRKGKAKMIETSTGEEEDTASESHANEIDALMAKASGSSAKGNSKLTPSSTTRPKEEIIVFDGGGSSRGSHGDDLNAKSNWRQFMNSKTASTKPEAFTSASEWIQQRTENKKKRAAEKSANGDDDGEDAADEAEQMTNDRELSHLLNTTLFARGEQRGSGSSSSKPDLSSHDTLSRILDLSSSSSARKGQTFGRGHGDKALKAQQLSQMPSKMRQGIREAAGERAAKEVERKQELGLLNSKYSRKLMGRQVADATMTGKKAASRDRDRGLSIGVGKYKNGTLHLSKDEVRRSLGESGGRGPAKKKGAPPKKKQRM